MADSLLVRLRTGGFFGSWAGARGGAAGDSEGMRNFGRAGPKGGLPERGSRLGDRKVV